MSSVTPTDRLFRSMNPVLEAIKTRRSAVNIKTEAVPEKNDVIKILEAGTWAPNHHLTEPWRFVVIAGEERKRLGEAMAAFVKRNTTNSQESSLDPKIALERAKPLRAPVIIAVVCSPRKIGNNADVQEEIVACGAALQNMLLAAQSLGLATMIKTGSSSYSDEVRDLLKMSKNELLIALVYLGYAEKVPESSRRAPVETKIEWRGL
ncbi:MAG: nitroreductase [Nitrososphaerota archaeon]|nr:nitroreductase [Nitrososphaerota archaeon]